MAYPGQVEHRCRGVLYFVAYVNTVLTYKGENLLENEHLLGVLKLRDFHRFEFLSSQMESLSKLSR